MDDHFASSALGPTIGGADAAAHFFAEVMMKRAVLAVTPFVATATGLCETCSYQNACGLRSDSDEPVLFCEEFSPLELEGRTPVKISASRLQVISAPDLTAQSEEWTGLCKNCANRFCCTLRKPAGGVWHCEEFA